MNRRCKAGKWRTYLVWRRRDEDDGNGAMTVQCHLLLFFVHFSFVLSFGLLFFFFFCFILFSLFFLLCVFLSVSFSFLVLSFFFFLCVPPPVFSLLVPLCSPFFFRGLSLSVRPGPSFLCLLVLFSPLILSFLLIFSVSSSWSLCVVSPCPLVFSPVFVPSPPSRLCSFRSPPVRGLYAMRSPPDNIFFFLPGQVRRRRWVVFFETAPFFNWNGYFQFASLKLFNLSIVPLFMENLFSFLILPRDQFQLNPCISASLTKQSFFSNLINSVLNWLFKF